MSPETFRPHVKEWRFVPPTIPIGRWEASEEDESYLDELVLDLLQEEPGVYGRIIEDFVEWGAPHVELELDTAIDIDLAARLRAAVARGDQPVVVAYYPELQRIALLRGDWFLR